MVKYSHNGWQITARTGMTSFGQQFDFHDAIHHIQPCNFDNRGSNVFLQLMDVQKVRKTYVRFSPKKTYWKFSHSVQDGGIVISWYFFYSFYALESK